MKIYYKSGYKYQLYKTIVVQTNIFPEAKIVTSFVTLGTDGVLSLIKGFAWDGASGYPDLKTIMKGSAFHDGLYRLMRKGLLNHKWKKEADNVLCDCCKRDGMYSWNVKTVRFGVSKWGRNSTLTKNRTKIHYAP